MINNNNWSPIYTKLFLGLIFLGLLKKSVFSITPLNPPGGTYLNPISYQAPLGGFGGKEILFQHPHLTIKTNHANNKLMIINIL